MALSGSEDESFERPTPNSYVRVSSHVIVPLSRQKTS